MVQRIRELNEQSYAFTSGYSTDPVTPRSYLLTPSKVLGRKKLTIDNVRPLHDYRFDLVPQLKTKVYKRRTYLASTYKGKKMARYGGKRVKSYITRTYMRHVQLKGRKRIPPVENGLVRMNDVYFVQVLGHCTPGILKTPPLPGGWTAWYHTGPLAVAGFSSLRLQDETGGQLDNFTQPITVEAKYAEPALLRATAKVTMPDVDFAEIIGELNQLTRLCADPFKTLGGLLRKFQRYFLRDEWISKPHRLSSMNLSGSKRLAYNPLDVPTILAGTLSIYTFRTRRKVGRKKLTNSMITEAAGRWLQYRYGIAPLIGDIGVIISKFMDKIKPLVKVYTAKSTIVAKKTSVTWLETRATPMPGFTVTYKYTVSIFDRYTAKVFYRMNILDKVVDLRDLGLDSSNLAPVVWELTQWSFVVDWFYAVGDWIRSWNQDPKLDVIGNCVSRKIDTNVRIDIISAAYYGYTCQVPQSRLYIHRAEMRRSVNQPVPEYPVFRPDFLKWRRVLDSLSLLWAKMPAIRR